MVELKRMRSVAETLLRRSAAVAATAIALSGVAGISGVSAASFPYTYDGFYGDNVTITFPGPGGASEPGGSGQIKLINNNDQSTVLAWCLDIYDWLQNTGTYAITPNGQFINASQSSATVGAHIGGLMAEGDSIIATNKTTTVDGVTFGAQDESAAIQVAIWSAENAGSGVTFSVSPTTGTPADFVDLVKTLNDLAGTHGYATLDPDPANCVGENRSNCTYPTNQQLGFETSSLITQSSAVPGPIVGAGLPGLMVACAALIALGRRRRQTAI